jgi:hypothetical protein
MTPCTSFHSVLSTPEPEPALGMPPLTSQSLRRPSRSGYEQGRHPRINLSINVCEPPVSLAIHVEHPLPGIPAAVRVFVV